MTLTVTAGHGGQWMFIIEAEDGSLVARSTLYLNERDARHAADRVVAGFGSGTVRELSSAG